MWPRVLTDHIFISSFTSIGFAEPVIFTRDCCDNSLLAFVHVLARASSGTDARVQPQTRPSRYFMVIREPMSRLLSEWRYFCLGCAKGGKFCGRNVATR